MNPYCRLVSLSIALVASAVHAAPEPQPGNSKGQAPIAVSFSATPVHFPVDGKEHHPVLTVRPAEATYVVEGTFTEKTSGAYIFTAKGTGRYVGSMTCRWTIDPPRHAPKKPAKAAPITEGGAK